MKKHKLNNKRNEKLFNRLLENQGISFSEMEERYNASQQSAALHRFDDYKSTIRLLVGAEVISNDLAKAATEEIYEPGKGLKSGEVPIYSGLEHYYAIEKAVAKAMRDRVDNAEEIAAAWKQTNRSVTEGAEKEDSDKKKVLGTEAQLAKEKEYVDNALGFLDTDVDKLFSNMEFPASSSSGYSLNKESVKGVYVTALYNLLTKNDPGPIPKMPEGGEGLNLAKKTHKELLDTAQKWLGPEAWTSSQLESLSEQELYERNYGILDGLFKLAGIYGTKAVEAIKPFFSKMDELDAAARPYAEDMANRALEAAKTGGIGVLAAGTEVGDGLLSGIKKLGKFSKVKAGRLKDFLFAATKEKFKAKAAKEEPSEEQLQQKLFSTAEAKALEDWAVESITGILGGDEDFRSRALKHNRKIRGYEQIDDKIVLPTIRELVSISMFKRSSIPKRIGGVTNPETIKELLVFMEDFAEVFQDKSIDESARRGLLYLFKEMMAYTIRDKFYAKYGADSQYLGSVDSQSAPGDNMSGDERAVSEYHKLHEAWKNFNRK